MNDIVFILHWWLILFVFGIGFLPANSIIFQKLYDKGYLFSKVLGIIIVSYLIFVFSIFKILPFTFITILGILILSALSLLFFTRKRIKKEELRKKIGIFIVEEIIFALSLFIYSYIRAHEPRINGLEKFMDFGFINSLLRADYLPPTDMWFPPFSINYYYFGHFITALLTKLSFIPSFITYNLMLATIFACTFSLSFSIGLNIVNGKSEKLLKKSIIAGILAALLVTFAGNLHPIYAFFLPYNTDAPKPFWELPFSFLKTVNDTTVIAFPNSYWYPNATRFIPFTIHEFPFYSFIVADLHGHVTDIIFVLFAIILSYTIFIEENRNIFSYIIYGLTLSIMYMTNAWDGAIYFLLIIFINIAKYIWQKQKENKNKSDYFSTKQLVYAIAIIGVSFISFTIPFSMHFKPFVSGIGVLCTPDFLTKLGKIGPFLFEKDHCQKSPWWQLLILYGFFYFLVFSFVIFIFSKSQKLLKAILLHSISWLIKIKTAQKNQAKFNFNFIPSDIFILLVILLSTLLILIPEFIYLKDIYPQHYRANTMFKLCYQAFIMLSLASSYIVCRIISGNIKKVFKIFNFYFVFFLLYCIFFTIIMMYPFFALQSFYQIPPPTIPSCNSSNSIICFFQSFEEFKKADAKNYKGLDGIAYLKNQNKNDYNAIVWLNKNIKGQPVILEAQGDSYTDYERISANTGLPTVLGWTVHEWLWRGTYDIPSPRIAEVKTLYESNNIIETMQLIKKYNIAYVYVGDLEREKYQQLIEEKFADIGTMVFESENTRIYKINKNVEQLKHR